MTLDLDALRAAVQAVEPLAEVYPWASQPKVFRVRRDPRLGKATIDIDCIVRVPRVECSLVKNRRDRAMLRAVLDYLDGQEEQP